MSRNERNGGDMVGNSGKCRNMMENVGKCAERRRKTEKRKQYYEKLIKFG